MKIESVEEFLKRGGKIKKVDFSQAYRKLTARHNLVLGSKKMTKIEHQKKRDSKSFRGIN